MKSALLGLILTGLISNSAAIAQSILPSRQPLYGQGCPCPYDYDSAGRICGGRSAFSRQGGRSPACYTTIQQTTTFPSQTSSSPIRQPRLGQGCECPYDLMKNGKTCGGRSAYSRPGGANPVCYTTDR